MEKPISIYCCKKQAKCYLSHVMVRRPESCQGLLFPIASKRSLNRSSMREQDASSMSAVNEVCDTSSWIVEMLLRTFFQMANLCLVVDMYPKQNPFQASSLNIASYTILSSLTTRLYLCHSITSVIDPSEVTSDPTHKSRRPAS